MPEGRDEGEGGLGRLRQRQRRRRQTGLCASEQAAPGNLKGTCLLTLERDRALKNSEERVGRALGAQPAWDGALVLGSRYMQTALDLQPRAVARGTLALPASLMQRWPAALGGAQTLTSHLHVDEEASRGPPKLRRPHSCAARRPFTAGKRRRCTPSQRCVCTAASCRQPHRGGLAALGYAAATAAAAAARTAGCGRLRPLPPPPCLACST